MTPGSLPAKGLKYTHLLDLGLETSPQGILGEIFSHNGVDFRTIRNANHVILGARPAPELERVPEHPGELGPPFTDTIALAPLGDALDRGVCGQRFRVLPVALWVHLRRDREASRPGRPATGEEATCPFEIPDRLIRLAPGVDRALIRKLKRPTGQVSFASTSDSGPRSATPECHAPAMSKYCPSPVRFVATMSWSHPRYNSDECIRSRT